MSKVSLVTTFLFFIYSLAGQKIGSNFFISGSDGNGGSTNVVQFPAIAYNTLEEEYLVVWTAEYDNIDNLDTLEAEIWGQLIDATTDTLIGNNFRISNLGPDGNGTFGANGSKVVYNPKYNEYLVVFYGDNDTSPIVNGESEIYGQRLDADGNEIGTDDFRISTMGDESEPDRVIRKKFDAYFPDVVYNETNDEYMVVWYGDNVENDLEIWGQRLRGVNGAEIGDDFRVSFVNTTDSVHINDDPIINWNSQNNEYLVTWHGGNFNDKAYQIYGQLMDSTGFLIDTTFQISNSFEEEAQEAHCAYNKDRNQYLVIWGDKSTEAQFLIKGQLLDSAGVKVDATINISENGENEIRYLDSQVAEIHYDSLGKEYVVVWSGNVDSDPTEADYQVHFIALDGSTGQTIDTAFVLSDLGGNTENNPSPAFSFRPSDRSYFTVWSSNISIGEDEFEPEIRGQHFETKHYTCNDGIQNGDEVDIDCGGSNCPTCSSCDDGIQNGDETGIDCGGADCPACPPSCDDGIQNGDETGIDCGGSCPMACPTCDDGIQNGDETGVDCGGADCPICPPTCDDGIQNGDETGVDCGGSDCPACSPSCDDGIQNGDETGIDCGGADCPACPPSCDDGIQNGDETGVDCGGSCPMACPTCDDGIQNGDETGVDCGGADCPICPPTCDDGIQNGDETGIDCGGSCPTACPTCEDGIQNGDETGVDCGGSCPTACPTCEDGIQNGDETGIDCGGSCPTACPTCEDGIQNGDETGVDCGGSCPTACPTCEDGIQNGDETGIDCGGSNCDPCSTETCDAPTGLFETNNTGSEVTLNWNSVANADSYMVQGRQQGTSIWRLNMSSNTNSTTISKNIRDGVTYEWRVRANCGDEESPYSEIATFMAGDNSNSPTCDDGIQNGDETGIDCGGSCPTSCPTCDDGIQNGDETGVDCGGSCPTACPTCEDGIQNGDETGIDCGGMDCPPCSTETCDVPTGLSTINIQTNQADLTWNMVDGANDYTVQLRPVGRNNWNTRTSSTNSGVARPLRPNTQYEWRVRSNCDDGSSEYSSIVTFTTANSRTEDRTKEITIETSFTVTVYPSPANKFVQVKGNRNIRKIEVVDITGRVVSVNIKLQGENATLDINSLVSGYYFLRIQAVGAVKTLRFVKQ